MNNTLSWGILGTGAIANIFAKGLAASTTGTLVAVASRTQTSANIFGNAFNVPHRHDSYEALLANPAVEAVYIATPHPLHAEWAIKAAEAGKHILCEKPIALNHAEAMSIIEAAQHHDVFLMEAFMYRCHPQTRKLIELIKAGAIGKVHFVQATFSFHINFNPERRLLNSALGGGGILDVGGYCVSMARLVAGAALGEDVAEPLAVKGMGHIGSISRVDEYATALLTFPHDIIAQLFCGVQVLGENVVRIFGSEGSIFIPEPWLPGRNNTVSTLIIKKNTGEEERITIECDTPLYALEADTVAHSIAARQAPAPAMRWDDTLGNMRTLDQWRAAIGMVYDAERPEG
jgi:predicted dehydrogenase